MSRELFKVLHQLTSKAPLARNRPIRDQITRAALSVMSNIAEGFDRGGDKEFIQFLFPAKGSCSELRSQLSAASDIGYLATDDYQKLFNLSEEISRVLQGLIASLKARDEKGHKFK